MRRHRISTLFVALCAIMTSSCTKDDTPTVSFEDNLKEGLEYLNENGKREGVITTDSGLQYEVIAEGKEDGAKPVVTDNVKCHYSGTFLDGTVFDSSYKRGEPAIFPLNGVIQGWTEGLQYMTEGAKYRFVIPYYLAYGAYGYATIPPYSTLIFEVELLEVIR